MCGGGIQAGWKGKNDLCVDGWCEHMKKKENLYWLIYFLIHIFLLNLNNQYVIKSKVYIH